jgi:hypothetical protein
VTDNIKYLGVILKSGKNCGKERKQVSIKGKSAPNSIRINILLRPRFPQQ